MGGEDERADGIHEDFQRIEAQSQMEKQKGGKGRTTGYQGTGGASGKRCGDHAERRD